MHAALMSKASCARNVEHLHRGVLGKLLHDLGVHLLHVVQEESAPVLSNL